MTEAAAHRHELRVVRGLHQGAALPLLDDRVTVGCDENGDVVLLDDGVLPLHLALIRTQDGGWVNESTAAPVPFGAWITMGSAAIVVCEVNAAWQSADRVDDHGADLFNGSPSQTREPSTGLQHMRVSLQGRALRWVVVALGGATFLLVTFVYAYSYAGLDGATESGPRTAKSQKNWQNASQKQPGQATLENDRALSTPEQAEQRALRMLRDRGLDERVAVRVADNTLYFEGSLSASEIKQVNSIAQELRQARLGDLKVELQLQSLQQSLPFEITEVLYGPVSSITLSDGARLKVGDIHLGMRLSEIRPGRMVFIGSRNIEVAW